MLGKYLTLVIIPQGTSRVIKIKLYQVIIRMLLFSALALFLVTLWLYYSYYSTNQHYLLYEQLLYDTLEQQVKYKGINSELSKFKKQISDLSLFDEKLRVIIGQEDSKYKTGIEINKIEEENSIFNLEVNQKLTPEEIRILKQIDNINLNLLIKEKSFSGLESEALRNIDKLRRTPYLSPVRRGYYISGFGIRIDPFTGTPRMHNGVDWAYRPYTPVYAPADGVVISSRYSESYGNILTLDHGYGIKTRYAHLAKFEVKLGQRVKRTELIARMGNTGKRSTGTHLHYEVIVNSKFVDPYKYILEDNRN